MSLREKLQMELRNVEGQIDMYTLAKNLDLQLDPMLEEILTITNEFKQLYKNNIQKMVKGNADYLNEFFNQQIVDLGFLCQHKIKDISDTLVDKHNTMGHRMFYDSWILHRGY